MSVYEYALSEYERGTAEQKSTITELETTIDGLADLNRDLEKELAEAKAEAERAREEADYLRKGMHRMRLSLDGAFDSLRAVDHDLIGTLQGDA